MTKLRIMESAYKRICKGGDFHDSLHKAMISTKSSENSLSDCFALLSSKVKELTDKKDRLTLTDYFDNDDYCNKTLFTSVIDDLKG